MRFPMYFTGSPGTLGLVQYLRAPGNPPSCGDRSPRYSLAKAGVEGSNPFSRSKKRPSCRYIGDSGVLFSRIGVASDETADGIRSPWGGWPVNEGLATSVAEVPTPGGGEFGSADAGGPGRGSPPSPVARHRKRPLLQQ